MTIVPRAAPGRLAMAMALCALAWGAHAVMTPDCSGLPGINFDETKDPVKTVALTFDDGPDSSGWTTGILNVLAEKGVKATFFINTNNFGSILANATMGDVVRRIVRDGHTLGSHTATHPNLSETSDQGIDTELGEVDRVVNQVLGIPNRLTLFRAPFGSPFQSGAADVQARVGAVLKRRGVVHVGWSCDAQDWDFVGKTDQALFNAYYSKCVASGITGPLLMHSASMGGFNVHLPALRQLIDAYRSAGYAFVSVEYYVTNKYGMSSAQVVDFCRGGQKASPPPPPPPPAVVGKPGTPRPATITGYNVMTSDNTGVPGSLAEYTVSQRFVDNVNIAAVHERDWPAFKYAQVDVTAQVGLVTKTVRFQVWDLCADKDCAGCCTSNLEGTGFLLDLESSAVLRNWGWRDAETTLKATASFVVVPPPVAPLAVLAQFNGSGPTPALPPPLPSTKSAPPPPNPPPPQSSTCPTAAGAARAACVCNGKANGYYADTLNKCSGAIFCYGAGQSSYMACPSGLQWNSAFNACDWPANVVCTGTPVSPPPVSTPKPSPPPPSPPPVSTPKPSPPPPSGCPTAPGAARAACMCKANPSVTYQADTLNGCTGYALCYGVGQSSYVTCPSGLRFDARSYTCNWANLVPC